MACPERERERERDRERREPKLDWDSNRVESSRVESSRVSWLANGRDSLISHTRRTETYTRERAIACTCVLASERMETRVYGRRF